MLDQLGTDAGRRTRDIINAWIYTLSAITTAVLIWTIPDRLISSVVWHYILDNLPGDDGYPVIAWWMTLCAVGMLAAMLRPCRHGAWPFVAAGAWYVWVSIQQIFVVLTQPTGTIGFMGWGPLGLLIVVHGLGHTNRFR